MILYLHGPDAYRKRQKVAEFIRDFQKKNPGAFPGRFSLENQGELSRLQHFINNQSLFSGAKLAIVERADSEPGAAPLLKSAKDDHAITIILLSDKKFGAGYSFLAKEPVAAHSFDALKGAELADFVRGEASNRGLKLASGVLLNLIARYGSDTWSIATELDKLSLGGTVEGGARPPDFFPLIQALKSKGFAERRLLALAYLLENEDSAAVFNITASLADPELKIKMADYDIAVKSGKLEYPEALTDLALSL